MHWIETLHIRTFSKPDCQAVTGAFCSMRQRLKAPFLAHSRLLKDMRLPTDLIIVLVWEKGLPESGRSRLGRQLYEAFSEFGLISWVTWVEETGSA